MNLLGEVMGTRSVIAKTNCDGTITGSYCHYDGYINHNGKILLESYSNDTKANKLIENGGISSLRKRIGTKHSFNNPPEGETTFYHRDRGEPLKVFTWKNHKEMMDQMYECEYFYIWDGDWYVSKGNEFVLVSSYFN